MTYALSFSRDFIDGPESNPPTSVYGALRQMSQETWADLAERVFGVDQLDIETVLRRVEETNTCLNLDSPVEVFIDPEGEFTVQVYDFPPTS